MKENRTRCPWELGTVSHLTRVDVAGSSPNVRHSTKNQVLLFLPSKNRGLCRVHSVATTYARPLRKAHEDPHCVGRHVCAEGHE